MTSKAPETKHTPEELASHFAYLDMLRESGATNMFGATPYLMRDQELDERTARNVLSLWMRSFRGGPTIDRARAALAKVQP